MQKIKWLIFFLLCISFNSEIESSQDSKEITEIPPTGLVISAPGTYVFKNNVTWSPSGSGQAILITASDVTLDLEGYVLESEITQFNTTGILATLVSNLVIKNGTIRHLAYQGIQCTGCANVVIKDITVDGLNLENIATFIVPVGIGASASTNVLINKCTVKNINVLTDSTAGIQLTGVIFSRISNCTVVNLLNRDGICSGIGHLLCDTGYVTSCEINNITTEFINNINTQGHTAIGIIPFLSTNLKIKHCKTSNVTGCCDDAHGMSVFECNNVLVKHCKVENVLDGAGPAQTGAKATGIEVYGNAVKVIKCSVKNITAINPQNKQSTGFSVAQAVGVKFIDCHAENVNVVNALGEHDPSLGFGTGFGWAPDPRITMPAVNILYKHCTAKKCQVGFDSFYHLDSLWKDIFSNCNTIPILNNNTSQKTLSCDVCSECGCLAIGCAPAPFSITLTNVAKDNTFLNVKVKTCK